MNGGSLSRVTSRPLIAPIAVPQQRSRAAARAPPGSPAFGGQVGHQDRGEDGDRAGRQVDAGGQDDQRLAQREHRDDGDLGQHQAEVGGREEPAAEDRERDDRQDQDRERAQDRAGVQDVLDAQAQRLGLAVLEARSGSGRRVVVPPAGRGVVGERRLPSGPPGPRGGARPTLPAGRAEDRQPQQFCWPKVVSLDVDAGLRLVGDQRDAGVDEGLAGGGLRLGAVLGERGDRLRRPAAAIFSGYCCEVAPSWPALTAVDAGAAAVDRDDRDVVLLARRLERLVRARRGRLVDRVDEVDRRVLLQQVLHRGAAAVLGAVGHVVADDPRVGLVADLVLVRDVDAEALEEALVALDVDGDLVGVQVEHRDLRLLALGLELRLGPLPDEQPAWKLSVAKVASTASGRVGRACPGR